MRTEIHGRPQYEPEFAGAAGAVLDVNGVLAVDHYNFLFEFNAFDRVAPDRHAVLEPKFFQVRGAVRAEWSADALFASELHRSAIFQLNCLDQLVEHHHAALVNGWRGDQIAVKAARDHAGQRARRVTTETIRDQPFLLQQLFGRRFGRPFPTELANDRIHDGRTFCERGMGSSTTAA